MSLRNLIILFLLGSFGCSETSELESFTFEAVAEDHSNIDFSNTLQENLSSRANLLDFDYFYNGAGVGAADLDNDGLPELFFCGNQVPNKLYRNEGKLRFSEVGSEAGINKGHGWSNGVTFVDINEDGLLDIYVSQGGPLGAGQRKNRLYVNQGQLTFTEEAADYGLDDSGISTQSTFFDYDQDGDLDCFVMNESELYGRDPVTFYRLQLEDPKAYYGSMSHLYRNEGGFFKDVTKEAGLTSPTFGLGLAVTDINQDGWADLYIANDYYVPDQLYINRRDGRFADRTKVHLSQLSFYGMGVDVGDIDGNGHQDIFVADMASKDHVRAKTLMASMDVESFDLLVNGLGMPHQYMFNTMQLNDGRGRFSNVAHQAGVAQTDWSWAPIIEDFDQDGDQDIYVTNGYRRYALDNDFKNNVIKAKIEHQGAVPLEKKQELYKSMPSETLANLYFENRGGLRFAENGADLGLQEKTFSNGALAADLDRDGDLDLVLNNIDQTAIVYRNRANETAKHWLSFSFAGNLEDHLPMVRIWVDGQPAVREVRRVRGYMSSTEPRAYFGLGSRDWVDSLEVVLQGQKQFKLGRTKADQVIHLDQEDFELEAQRTRNTRSYIKTLPPAALSLDYEHRENEYNDFAKEILLPQKQSTLGPMTATADVNRDGREDLFVGGASGQPSALYLQQPDGSFASQEIMAFERDRQHEDLGAEFFDLDGDGDLDLYVVSGGNAFPAGDRRYQDRLYINDGDGQYRRSSQSLIKRVSGKCVKAIDLEGDGDMDLIVGNRIQPQSYPLAAPSLLLLNENGVLVDRTEDLAPALSSFGIINDISVADLDLDGDSDAVVVGEWTGVGILKNHDGRLELDSSNLTDLMGLWQSLIETDINGDGYIDLIVGNIGLNIKHSASTQAPFRIYAEDFDASGSLDIVLAKTYKDNYVPVRGRECSSQQMPFIAEEFVSYNDFAHASLEDIYGDDLSSAYQGYANTFSSYILVNDGTGDFNVEELPEVAQTFPVLGGVSEDINGDGYLDLVLAGGIYNTEVETPRLDAGSGIVLFGDGQDGYQLGECPDWCIHIPGNIKDLSSINIVGDRQLMVVTRNNEGLYLLELPGKRSGD